MELKHLEKWDKIKESKKENLYFVHSVMNTGSNKVFAWNIFFSLFKFLEIVHYSYIL